MRRFVPLLATVIACTGPAQVDEAACADICAGKTGGASTDGAGSGGGLVLSAFEEQILADTVNDMRQGVRPFDENNLGICPKGDNPRRCDTMMGANPGELPEGEYILYGSFMVPNVGERGTWKVKNVVECEVTRTLPDGTVKTDTRDPWEREYEVVYAGQERGYTLSPLRRITSPGKNGAESCTFKIIAPHPDGEKVFEGSWSVPAAPE